MTQDQMFLYFYERFRSSFIGVTVTTKTANGAALTLAESPISELRRKIASTAFEMVNPYPTMDFALQGH